ncbi:unnamed protein product [Anisakis simplex]|uniref:DUF3800 domain-containing protein n=1 Tax=Anisakis simplex TaxID=6269 RepID=A0A0M3JGU4_ANISI|nr:unnamed protein product [Anisakis simplex]
MFMAIDEYGFGVVRTLLNALHKESFWQRNYSKVDSLNWIR